MQTVNPPEDLMQGFNTPKEQDRNIDTPQSYQQYRQLQQYCYSKQRALEFPRAQHTDIRTK